MERASRGVGVGALDVENLACILHDHRGRIGGTVTPVDRPRVGARRGKGIGNREGGHVDLRSRDTAERSHRGGRGNDGHVGDDGGAVGDARRRARGVGRIGDSNGDAVGRAGDRQGRVGVGSRDAVVEAAGVDERPRAGMPVAPIDGGAEWPVVGGDDGRDRPRVGIANQRTRRQRVDPCHAGDRQQGSLLQVIEGGTPLDPPGGSVYQPGSKPQDLVA